MAPRFPPLAVVAAVAVLGGCAVAAEQPPLAQQVPASTAPCASTEATPKYLLPPALEGQTDPWFGEGDLWVNLPDPRAAPTGDGLELKFPWVFLADGAPSTALGPPVVRAERAGGQAPPDAAVEATVGEPFESFGVRPLSLWPSALTLPEEGCWAVTGSVGEESVRFVVDVRAA